MNLSQLRVVQSAGRVSVVDVKGSHRSRAVGVRVASRVLWELDKTAPWVRVCL